MKKNNKIVMLFETLEQFEECLEKRTKSMDETGELAAIVIDYINLKSPVAEFVVWLETKCERIPHVKKLHNPRYGNCAVDLVGENAYKYFYGAPSENITDDQIATAAEKLLYELSYYLAITTTTLFAEEQGILKKGFNERFMKLNKLFYSYPVQFGYVATRLETPAFGEYLLKDSMKIFETFEGLTEYGVYIVHGDCKLDNILVNCEGTFCLIDFGLSTIQLHFGDGNILSGKYTQKAPSLMFIDPLLFAITYTNKSNSELSPEKDFFGILCHYDNQDDFIEDMYNISYSFFYMYHSKHGFNLKTYFPEYLKLKKS